MVLEKTLESSLDCKEIQPVHSEGDQPWVFIGRTDVEAETPIVWPHLMQRVEDCSYVINRRSVSELSLLECNL